MLFRITHRNSRGLSSARRRYLGSISTKPNAFDILFLGRDEFSCLVLQHLYDAHDVWKTIRVVTQPDMKVGRRGSQLAISPLRTLGEQLTLPVQYIPRDKAAFRDWKLPAPFDATPPVPSHLLVTASFGRILTKSMLANFEPSNRLNVHPSLLPVYRGASPIQHTILNGEKETGVCVIEMMERKKGIDAGTIWGTARMNVPENSDFTSLRDVLGHEGGRLLVNTLRGILCGKAVPCPQTSDPTAPRAPLITSADAIVDFRTMTATQIIRRHRAISHQKPLHVYLRNGRTLQLHSLSIADASHISAHVLPQLYEPGTAFYDSYHRSLLVRCSDKSILKVEKVKQQDRALLAAKEWWNGVSSDLRVTQNNESGPILLSSDPSISR
ncbi:hypothetical protein QCA50_016692 [Cerrena zonata]|uniref:methionyl-tRNA formyltransferase n=1 Tax=Cerrena zonata TaxID=2478898 RepID=A0AAW0FEQ9_9APHY